MEPGLLALSTTAAALGIIHTLSGPDHYLPFIVMSKARNWSVSRTFVITILCGLGHVGSSILIGIVGIFFGLGISSLDFFEGFRGNIAGWLFILFGLVYLIWGLIKETKHQAAHRAGHLHKHHLPRFHQHTDEPKPVNITPWVLFTIFVFGPCEPLIPLLMYPAAKFSMMATGMVAIIFSVCTIGTMTVTVWLASTGFKFLPMQFLNNYMHSIAGATILLCGISIQFLGL